jgi:hypothetical protein
MITKIIFVWDLMTGAIHSEGFNSDLSREQYTIHKQDSEYPDVTMHVENAYKEEILHWIETGKFVYDEDMK